MRMPHYQVNVIKLLLHGFKRGTVMLINHREIMFELAIEVHLLNNGYISADRENFHQNLCLDPTIIIHFIQETQPKQ
jgi:hypothetical protein